MGSSLLSSLNPAPLRSEGRSPWVRIVHISDLHVGADSAHDFAAAALARSLVRAADSDLIALTGDVTDSGSRAELALFWKLFEPLRHKLVIVPGNHDRGTDNAAATFTQGPAWCRDFYDLNIRCICLDSTQPGNEVSMFAWGGVDADQIEYAAKAADDALSAGYFPIILLHHHVLPGESGEDILTTVSDALELPFMRHADNGLRLLARLPGTCLILHGHKHADMSRHPVYNAGSTTEKNAYRIFGVMPRSPLNRQTPYWVTYSAQWTPEAEEAIRAARAP